MMRRLIFTLACVAAVMAGAGGASAQLHPSEMPPLTADASFPRNPAHLLEIVGYPDHLHSYNWSGWEPLVGPDGVTYGPKCICDKVGNLTPREGLVVEPDQKSFGRFQIRHNPGYLDCPMIRYLEILDWADRRVTDLLGLAVDDTLMVVNPDNTDQYTQMTGQGVWRFYRWDDNGCTMQPWPVLEKRTLEGHGAFMLVTDWILRVNLGDELPRWLHQGLVEYVAENGSHHLSYMAEFKVKGEVLIPPAEIDSILNAGLNPDPGTDRMNYRMACYGAFLMVWQLVEQEGGISAMREFLTTAAAGTDVDVAARQVYGMGLEDLAIFLNPVLNGEPATTGVSRQFPHVQP